MLRLDKFIANLGLITRRQIPEIIKKQGITINGELAKKGDQKIQYGDKVALYEQEFEVRKNIHILLNKPKGFVCSELDEGGHLSYKTLLEDCPYANLLHVAGRLDQDTTGLVIATSDGTFTHSLIKPNKNVQKVYLVETAFELKDTDKENLENGVILDDGYKTLPSKCEILGKNKIRLTITEGKYHQIKRMLEALGNMVINLHRESIGKWSVEGIDEGKRVEFTP